MIKDKEKYAKHGESYIQHTVLEQRKKFNMIYTILNDLFDYTDALVFMVAPRLGQLSNVDTLK